MSYWTNHKVLVTGGTGFLGHHLVAALNNFQPKEVIALGSRDYDLTNEEQVKKMFKEHKPDIVFHLAGLVGGILANKQRPADFFYKNLMMGTLVIHHASQNGVKRMIAAGAGCGYPENAPMPLKESDLWSGFPQKESAPYSLAKRMLSIQSVAYYQQHNFESLICIPGNIYGEYDNFNLNDSHVIPALVRKFVEAVQENKPTVEVWSDGSATRDFIYAGDAAAGMIMAAEVGAPTEVINLSSGTETSIREACETLKKITGFKGQIKWDSDKPGGQKRRTFDISKAQNLLDFAAKTNLEEGLKRTCEWFERNNKTSQVRK